MILKKINYRLALTLLLVLFVFNFFPLLLLAADPLVPCGTGDTAGPDSCKWQDLVQLFNNVTDFIFLDLMIPLAVIAIVYAGIKILISRDKPAKLSDAYKTLQNVGIGIFMALGAYAIVKTILTLLPGNENGFLDKVIQQVFGS